MKLPIDLRNEIYKQAFTCVVIDIPPAVRMFERRSIPPGLLTTCKNVYLEAIDIYYATVTLFFRQDGPTFADGHKSLRPWFKKIGVARVKDIHLEYNVRAVSHSSRRFLSGDARTKQRFLEQHLEDFGLAPGSLKTGMDFIGGVVWTDVPVDLVSKVLDLATQNQVTMGHSSGHLNQVKG